MRISAISIKNFRSFNDYGDTITLGEMAAFVGKNSSGKSNILQALQLFWENVGVEAKDFYYGDTSRTISITVTFSGFEKPVSPAFLPFVSKNGYLKLCKEFTLSDSKGKLWAIGKNKYIGLLEMNPFPPKKMSSAKIQAFLQTENAQQLYSYCEEKGGSLNEQTFYDVLGKYWVDHLESYPAEWSAEKDMIDASTQKSIFSVLPDYYYLPVSYTTSKMIQDKRSYYQRIYQQILGDVDQLLVGERAEKLKKQVDKLYQESGIIKRCENINQVLQGINGADASIKMHIEIGDPDYSSLISPASFLRVDDGYDCDIQNKGQGVQRDAIFRLLRVFTQINKKQKKQFILAVDEPEAFMHPTYKRSLYKSFIDLCKAGCQVLYTTHDPAFVSVSRFDDIHTVHVEHNTTQYSSVFSGCFSTIMQKEIFKKSCRCKTEITIRREIEHKCQGDQNEGFFADRVVLVEGATEKYALPVYFSSMGYDIDADNTVILQAQSKTLLLLLSAIFSSCQIPCYCIFDGDKPDNDIYSRYIKNKPLDDKERTAFRMIGERSRLNRSLIAAFQGTPEDFPQTTISDFYTIWERDFEHAIQRNLQNYSSLKQRITQMEGVPSESKPLIAYHLARKSKISDFPQGIQEMLSLLLQKIKNCSCLPLADLPARKNVISLYNEIIDGAVPVYVSAAGRNTFVDDDTPNCYAVGQFPKDTSYLVHIQGNSMESQIPDGCYVAVKRVCEWIRPGMIGIFLLESGEITCKKYIETENGMRMLKALNPECASIQLSDEMNCQVRGEVIMLAKKNPAIFWA